MHVLPLIASVAPAIVAAGALVGVAGNLAGRERPAVESVEVALPPQPPAYADVPRAGPEAAPGIEAPPVGPLLSTVPEPEQPAVVPQRDAVLDVAGAEAEAAPQSAEPPAPAPRTAANLPLHELRAGRYVDAAPSPNPVIGAPGVEPNTELAMAPEESDDRPVPPAEKEVPLAERLTPDETVMPIVPAERLERSDMLAGLAPARDEPPVRDAPAEPNHRIVVEEGHSLWQLSREIYGRGAEYTIIYEANRDRIRHPDRIWPGQILITPQRRDDADR